MKATDETKQAAKAAGIKSWHVKSEEKLQDELALLNETTTTNTGGDNEPEGLEKPILDNSSVDINVVQKPKQKEKLKLPTDIDKKTMKFSVKCVGEKSPYWKYRDML